MFSRHRTHPGEPLKRLYLNMSSSSCSSEYRTRSDERVLLNVNHVLSIVERAPSLVQHVALKTDHVALRPEHDLSTSNMFTSENDMIHQTWNMFRCRQNLFCPKCLIDLAYSHISCWTCSITDHIALDRVLRVPRDQVLAIRSHRSWSYFRTEKFDRSRWYEGVCLSMWDAQLVEQDDVFRK